jgi:beta-glucosidase
MRKLITPCRILLVAASLVARGQVKTPADAPYRNPNVPVEKRVADVLSRMTLEEKASMVGGAGWMQSAGVERLGIPPIRMADGPLGVRSWAGSSAITNAPGSTLQVRTTAFPAGVAMAATWDPDLVQREGQAIGQEIKSLGRDMILGPTVNINRQPLWGRNFEGYGEDPYLAARLGVAYIRGVQSEGVIPSVKHFAANNQEFERRRIDEQIDDRTLHEIYLPAFKAAVQEGGAWTVMSSYNKVNGANASENGTLLKDVLRREFGFKGFVVSDWASTYSTDKPVIAGLDLEMPGGADATRYIETPAAAASGASGNWLQSDKVLKALQNGEITEATLNENVGHLLWVIFKSGLFDHPQRTLGEVDTPAQRSLAREGATESIVLLKNANKLLPLDRTRMKSIAVIGANADMAAAGGGSSMVAPRQVVTPLEAIRELAGSGIQVNFAKGTDTKDPGAEQLAKLRQEAAEAAKQADVAVVIVGRASTEESEGKDLASMDLPRGQNELIAEVEKANPKTIVVLNTGNPVTMTSWLEQTPALLEMWYAGEEGGTALASILFGEANPSGKLPVTFPKKWEDSPAYGHYPGENLKVNYAEGIYVGYRYFDTKKIEPQFPFGFGLSYSTFEYSNLSVRRSNGKFVASVIVKNSGIRDGAEVVQMYVHDGHSKVDRPEHELKGFRRIELKAGERKSVEFEFDSSALSYWSVDARRWVADPGTFIIQIGASSRNINLSSPIRIGVNELPFVSQTTIGN